MMSDLKPDEYFDDFPPSAHGSVSAREFFEIYKSAQLLARQLPKIKGVSETEKISMLTREYKSALPEQRALFRKASDAKDALAIYWLAKCRVQAKSALALLPAKKPFKELSLDDMTQLARLSVDVATLRKLPDLLLEKGIVLAIEPSIPGMKIDGAAFRLEDGTPVVALSLRHDRLDNFWFTLMHELAHVSLHYARLAEPIVDDLDDEPTDLFEKQADRRASDALISRHDWAGSDLRYGRVDEGDIVAAAKKFGVHPAIVAGRLQRALGNYSLFRDLVSAVSIREVYLREE